MTRRLLFLNGLAILMIPLHHATAYGFQAMFQWTDRYRDVAVPNFDQLGSAAYYVFVVLRQLDTFSVPGFLFISGFFIAFMVRGKETQISWKILLPRIRILILPFLIWTVIRYLLLRQWPSSLDDLLDPYHFIPILIQFYLLSPLLVPLARKYPLRFLAAFAALHLSIQAARYLNSLGVAAPGIDTILFLTPRWLFYGQQPFWFPLGLVYGLHTKAFNEFLDRYKNFLLAGVVGFGLIGIAEYFLADQLNGSAWIGPNFSGFSRNLFILSFLLAVIAFIEARSTLAGRIVDVGTRSLGIYLANIPFIYVAAVFMYRLTPALLGIQIVYVPVLIVVGLLGPIALMEIVRRSPLRGAYRYLFG